jgi:hypothetical protein
MFGCPVWQLKREFTPSKSILLCLVLLHFFVASMHFTFQNQFWMKLEFLASWNQFSHCGFCFNQFLSFALEFNCLSTHNFYFHTLKLILVLHTSKSNSDAKYPNTGFHKNHFCFEVSKPKSLYIQLTFNQNQFYKINSIKINFRHRTTKHTRHYKLHYY